jgi:signal peptidase I
MGKIAGWILFLSAVSFMLFVTVVQMAAPQKAVDILGFRLYLIADTRSMDPVMQAHDMVAVGKHDFNDLAEGDYITFEAAARVNGEAQTITVTHAIVAVTTDGDGRRAYQTRGVNPEVGVDSVLVTADGADGTNRYIGKVAFTNRFFGKVFAFMRTPAGICVLAANAALLILITLLVKFWKKKDAAAAKAGAGSEDAERDADAVITPEMKTKDFASETVVKRHERAPKNKKPEEFDVLEFEIVDGTGVVG